MKTKIIILSISLICWFSSLSLSFAQIIDIPSSPNPVGSGAVAMGMGGAYIAMAYDATAASWNPACLIRLDYPEASFVGNWFYRDEGDTKGGIMDVESGSVDKADINYISVALPFDSLFDCDFFKKRRSVISLNYQRLYDFTQELKYSEDKNRYEYIQKGGLSALGIGLGVAIHPTDFAVGVTFNFWNDGLNSWEKNKHTWEQTGEQNFNEKYSFKGFNANIGALWNYCGEDWLRIGAVVKLPFTANLGYTLTADFITNDYPPVELEMPISYGIGFSAEITEKFTIAGDIYRTRWKDFIIRSSNGSEWSPISAVPSDKSDIGDTTQVRLGLEYVVEKPESMWALPLRLGLFYDPLPDRDNPDDCYGISGGFGFVKKIRSETKCPLKKYSFDFSYQYRWANDVGGSKYESQKYYAFAKDIQEHMVYASTILYFDFE